MNIFLSLLTAIPQYVAVEVEHASTGLEWMVIASFIVPIVFLLVLLYIGNKITV